MSFFSEQDQRLIESLVFNPLLNPVYEPMWSCLTWKDEWPDGISSEGLEKLRDLWVARALIFHDPSMIDWVMEPEHFHRVWVEALEDGFSWPGFKRLHLSSKDKEYFEAEQRNAGADADEM